MNLNTKTLKKYEKKTIAWLLQKAQDVFNAYIRKRDSEDGWFTCISCNKPKPVEQMNAGHFFSAGHHTALRYHEDNVHGQCIACNQHLHGNLIMYQENLIKKIGQDRVEFLRNNCRKTSKWERIALIEII